MDTVQGDRCTLDGGQGGRVLLTGSFGTVGSHVLLHLVGQAYDPVCFDVDNEPNRRIRERLASTLAFDTVWGDLCQPQAVQEMVNRVRPQAGQKALVQVS